LNNRELNMKRSMLLHCAFVTLFITGCTDTDQSSDLRTRAREIHDAVITIDSHDDIPFTFATEAVDPLNAARQVNLEKMRAGGLNVGFFIVFVGQTERTPENYAQAKADAMTKFNAIHRMADDMYPELIELAYTADDVERIYASGKLVAAIGIDNGYVIGQDLSLLERYTRTTVLLGVIAIAKSRVEEVDEVTGRLRAALEHIDAHRLVAAPDCGLGLLGRDLAVRKLARLCEAARCAHA